MKMLSPGYFFLLGLIPLIGLFYIFMLRRRQPFAIRYSSLALVREALPPQSPWRRHVPFALFLLALVSLIIALGRPTATVSLPTDQTNIILAIDASGSMDAVDIHPSRLAAANAAARAFIQRQKSRTQIGLVAFSSSAALVQRPTSTQADLQAAIDNLDTASGGTAIGTGILKSLDAIAEIDKQVLPSTSDRSSKPAATPAAERAYVADVIVLLTDGENTDGTPPLEAAQQAVERGVRIYTIGYEPAKALAMSSGRVDASSGGPTSGVDQTTLKQIAEMTGGAYYAASSADSLNRIFENLPTYLTTRAEMIEISVAFAAIGGILAVLAIGLSLFRHTFP